MKDQSLSKDEANRQLFELSEMLGHHSEKFARIAHLNNDFVANYLIGFLGEGDLRLLQEKEYLPTMVNGLVALKWLFLHNINFEISYAKLHDTNPLTQVEFDVVLADLLWLPKIGESGN